DPSDDGGAGDEVIAVGQEFFEQGDVLGVPHDPSVVRVVVVSAPQRAVFREVVEADDLGAGGKELFDEITGDEAGRTGDQDPHDSSAPFPKRFQMSMTGLPWGICRARYSACGAPTMSRSDRATTSSRGRNDGFWM